jgi:hypothetical protein
LPLRPVERFAVNGVLESLAFQKLPDQERLPLMLSNLMDGADVEMVECGRSASRLKALERIWI